MYTDTMHKKINHVLSLVVVALGCYMVIMPFWPSIRYSLITSRQDPVVYGENEDSVQRNLPTDNRIVIPAAHIDQPIIEGSELSVIDQGGAWRKSTWVDSPESIGNTVIVGHRFTYANPEGAFYHLDKVQIGDVVFVYWEGEELIYQVGEIQTVAPSEIEVEQDTSDRRLTLYTCTPLVTADKRLVIVAYPQEQEHDHS